MERHLLAARHEVHPVIDDGTLIHISGADRVRIACRVLGADHDRTVILTSGIGCGPVFMNRVARELARDHKVVYWDYRAHGDSDTASAGSGYGIADHAADLDHVVRAFCDGERPVMVAFSMGVQVNVEWTRTNPGRAAAHVYMLGVPRNPMHRTVVLRKRAARIAEGIAVGARPLLHLIQPATRAALRTPITYVLARSLGVVREGCPLGEFSDFVRYATAVPLDAYLRCCAGLLEHDATDAFLRVQEPLLMMAGEHDVFIDYDDVKAFAELHPRAEFEPLNCASHAGSLEYGTFVAGRVRAFIDRNVPRIGRSAAA